MIEDKEFTKGQDLIEIWAEKPGQEYFAELLAKYMHAILWATHGKRMSDSVKTVYFVYVVLSTKSNPVILPTEQLAKLCELNHTTVRKAKAQLIKAGLLYKLGRVRNTEPDRIGVADCIKIVLGNSEGENSEGENSDHNHVLRESHDHLYGHDSYIDNNSINLKSIGLESNYSLSKTLLESTHLESNSSSKKHSLREDALARIARTRREGTRDVGTERDRDTREELEAIFAEPVDKTASSLRVPIAKGTESKGQGKSQSSFFLTPPRPRAAKQKVTPQRRARPTGQVPPELLDRMLRLCFGVTTVKQYGVLQKQDLARCSDAIIRLIDSGADLTRFDDFEQWWFSWAKTSPNPTQVLSYWWKAMASNGSHSSPAEDQAMKRMRENNMLTDEQLEKGLRWLHEERDKQDEG